MPKNLKLSKEEYKQLLDQLRHLSPDVVKRIAPLVWHISALEKEIFDVHKKIQLIIQPDFFPKNNSNII